MNELINEKGFCKTAPDPPRLLIMLTLRDLNSMFFAGTYLNSEVIAFPNVKKKKTK